MKGSNIKFFFLGAAIVASGLWAAAVTIPNNFAAGDALSASKLNANFAAVKTAVDALEAPGSVTTAKLAAGAVNAAKTSDEPGGAQAVSTAVNSIDTAGYKVLLNKIITAPAAGFVLAIGSGEFCVNHVTTKDSGFGVAVSTGTAVADGTDKAFLLAPAIPTGFYCTTMTVQKIFPVTAGENTINFIGSKFFAANPNAEANDMTLSLVYFPTAYGSIDQ